MSVPIWEVTFDYPVTGAQIIVAAGALIQASNETLGEIADDVTLSELVCIPVAKTMNGYLVGRHSDNIDHQLIVKAAIDESVIETDAQYVTCLVIPHLWPWLDSTPTYAESPSQHAFASSLDFATSLKQLRGYTLLD